MYFKYYIDNLYIEILIYNLCLLISKMGITETTGFSIIGMQIDNTLSLSDDTFAAIENTKLRFLAKDKQVLTCNIPIVFNRCVITIIDGGLSL